MIDNPFFKNFKNLSNTFRKKSIFALYSFLDALKQSTVQNLYVDIHHRIEKIYIKLSKESKIMQHFLKKTIFVIACVRQGITFHKIKCRQECLPNDSFKILCFPTFVH